MTPDYQKTVSVNAAPDTVFDALTTLAGLGAWWTRVTGSGDAGGELRFFFSHPDPCVMRVDEATRPSVVRWTVTSCDFLPDWVGTRPVFTIVPVDGATEIRFRHHGLTAELDCLDMCTRGWNHFTESLRVYAESGVGMPSGSPADLARRR
ncbi:SRPBCC domain-containing protein [Amycolatopsis sp. NPDC005232]|uniref:SRPBCC family protein n=1 Tax=Amycolatopsis sp. NPDC005232 TaxID=3157027 RepID=UPI0033BE728D